MSEIAQVIEVRDGRAVCDTGGGITYDVEIFRSPGDDYMPEKGDFVLLHEVQGLGERVILGSRNNLQGNTNPGDKKLFSSDNNAESAVLLLDSSGNISLNGDGKRFVTFSELASALNLFINQLNLHVHAIPGGNSGPPNVPLVLDISAAETTTVRTGG